MRHATPRRPTFKSMMNKHDSVMTKKVPATRPSRRLVPLAALVEKDLSWFPEREPVLTCCQSGVHDGTGPLYVSPSHHSLLFPRNVSARFGTSLSPLSIIAPLMLPSTGDAYPSASSKAIAGHRVALTLLIGRHPECNLCGAGRAPVRFRLIWKL